MNTAAFFGVLQKNGIVLLFQSVRAHSSILAVIPYLFESADIIVSSPLKIIWIDRVMDIIKDPRFSRPSQIILVYMPLINMDIDDFETYQNRIVAFGNFLLLSFFIYFTM